MRRKVQDGQTRHARAMRSAPAVSQKVVEGAVLRSVGNFAESERALRSALLLPTVVAGEPAGMYYAYRGLAQTLSMSGRRVEVGRGCRVLVARAIPTAARVVRIFCVGCSRVVQTTHSTPPCLHSRSPPSSRRSTRIQQTWRWRSRQRLSRLIYRSIARAWGWQ